MQVDVVDIGNQKVGTFDLPDEIFSCEVNESLIREQVLAQRASRRAGTHATKTRANVSGGGAKPYKQKGTGRARQGSTRAPHFVGGGTVFGPKPRDYSYRLPRSARRAALRSALSLRAREGAIVVLDAFPVPTPKTKSAVMVLDRIGCVNALVLDADNHGLGLSVRNLPKTKYLIGSAVNVEDIMAHEKLVLTRAAVGAVVERAATTTMKSDVDAA